MALFRDAVFEEIWYLSKCCRLSHFHLVKVTLGDNPTTCLWHVMDPASVSWQMHNLCNSGRYWCHCDCQGQFFNLFVTQHGTLRLSDGSCTTHTVSQYSQWHTLNHLMNLESLIVSWFWHVIVTIMWQLHYLFVTQSTAVQLWDDTCTLYNIFLLWYIICGIVILTNSLVNMTKMETGVYTLLWDLYI